MVVDVGRRTFVVAVLLAALAGYVDAMGYITLGGFFVSFMSGNSTRMAVGAVDGHWHVAAVGAGVIGLFVLGVVLGSVLGRIARARRRALVMCLVAGLLVAAVTASAIGPRQVVIAALALAMGAENTVFERTGEASISLTYMTGTLVKLGQRIAAALTGGPRWEWVRFAGLWLGLVLGVVAGAAVHRGVGLAGLWAAVALALLLAVLFARDRLSAART
ncbi:YoaK family protein [Rhodococcus sp. UNC363MFTsu5.1]|uniref:YoaK family protein n=1 Tax=Rhodococcus sp. UNC363MFTsu5.1 TaxID=1449069 RepID=UPI000487DB06|nr:YoaK family protein [Rhodococcus sp. UNC363MFTsu5.1]